MTGYLKNAVRLLAVLLVVALALSVVPRLIDESITENAAAQEDGPYLEVGWQAEVIKWNPLDMDMVEDYVVAGLVYDGLLTYDQDWNGPVFELATGVWQKIIPGTPRDTMEIYINITHNAYFRGIDDPDDISHPLTALDVAATFNMIMNTTGGTYDWYLTEYSYLTPIKRGVYWDQVMFTVPRVKATVLDDISGIPILPMYEGSFWDTIGNPLGNIKPGDNIGSGAFMFEDWERALWYKFKTAPNYWGATDFPGVKEVKIPGITFSVYGAVPAMCGDINAGDIDVAVLTGDLNSYKNAVGGSLAKVNIIKTPVQEIGITDIAINALPDCFDTGGGYLNRHEALEDPYVRKAIMMTLNKDYIVNHMLEGLPVRAASVVQPGFWQAEIDELPYDPVGAKEMLEENGWEDTDNDGWLEARDAELVYGVREGLFPLGTELSGIRCQAIDTDLNYKAIALAWPGWAELAGIELLGSVEDETTMVNDAWYACDYDIWVWHWGWGPEPIGGALTVWLTSEIEKSGDNCQMPMGEWWAYLDEEGDENITTCGFISDEMIAEYGIWDDPWLGRFSSFDQNITDAMGILDVNERKVILDKLQQEIYDSYCENPPYYDLGLYAMTDYRFENWGDWKAHSGLNTQAGLKWLYYMLEPVENRAPVLDYPLREDYTAYTTTPKRFNITLHDFEGDEMYVNFTFGDGSDPISTHLPASSPNALQNVEVFYQYATPGTYTLNLSVCDKFEGTFEDRYIYREAKVLVYGEANEPVQFTAFDWSPDTLVYVDDEVEWTATVKDPDSGTKGTDFKFTWDWDDGTYTVEVKDSVPDNTAVTSTVTHSWDLPDTYRVTCNVWDYPAGAVEEEGEHNVSVSVDFLVVVNVPPEDPTVQAIAGPSNQPLSCVAHTIDADLESLRFTWDWGDDTYTVEDVMPDYAGQLVFTEVTHTWTAEGDFPVMVYVEDEYGYNRSTEITAVIDDSATVAPSAIILRYTPDPTFAEMETTFNVSAVDADGDAITFTVDYDDGSTPDTDTTDGGVTTRQYAEEFLHTYDDEGTYEVNVTVEDDSTLSNWVVFKVVVKGNTAPNLLIQNVYSAKYSVETTIVPLRATDPDGDELTVWYDWGDDSVSQGDPDNSYQGKHTYWSIGEFRLNVSADDGRGQNVTMSATMTVTEKNIKPVVENIDIVPKKDDYSIDELLTFVVTVSDLEGDNVTVTIDFGDGEDDETTVNLDPGVAMEIEFTHSYETDDDYVVNVTADDGQPHSEEGLPFRTKDVKVVPDPSQFALIMGIAALALIAAIAAVLLIKRRKGGKMPTGAEGMEGMAMPDETTPPTDESPPPPQQ